MDFCFWVTAVVYLICRIRKYREYVNMYDKRLINEQFSKYLAKIILEKKISVPVIATRANISSSNIYSILRGERTPTIYTLAMICDEIGMSFTEFFVGLDSEIGNNINKEEKAIQVFMNERISRLSSLDREIILELSDILYKKHKDRLDA